jgi:hypothetical protein
MEIDRVIMLAKILYCYILCKNSYISLSVEQMQIYIQR